MVNHYTHTATGSLNLPHCWIWNMRSPPLTYSITKYSRSYGKTGNTEYTVVEYEVNTFGNVVSFTQVTLAGIGFKVISPTQLFSYSYQQMLRFISFCAVCLKFCKSSSGMFLIHKNAIHNSSIPYLRSTLDPSCKLNIVHTMKMIFMHICKTAVKSNYPIHYFHHFACITATPTRWI